MMPSSYRTATMNAARTIGLFSLFSAAVMAHARPQDQMTHEQLHRRATQQYEGCYKDAGSLEVKGTYMYQSTGYCGEQCTSDDQAVMGLTNGNACWCGGSIPAESDKVDDDKCNSPCTGFGQDNCGGSGFFSIYLTGISGNVPTDGGSKSSNGGGSSSNGGGSSSTSASETVITSTSPGQTVVVTVPAAASTSGGSSSSRGGGGGGGGSSTAGIAAGVVVGVVAIAGIIGVLVFWMKKKKRKQAEEDYKQRTQVSDFMRGASERKPPGTGYSGMSDQRLDPEAGARRNSVGSLADNQDYSRRILRVANPDSS